jgi:hypothetical protein
MSTQVGRTKKTAYVLDVTFPGGTFTKKPIVLLSPFWEDSNVQVSYIDTITRVDVASFTVVSENRAPNYFVHWLASDDY